MDSLLKFAPTCDKADVRVVFYALATQLDSSLHESLKNKLKEIRVFNSLFDILDDEELIPVGSSIDGSKVNTPGDYGDVDVLLVPKRIVLNESLFEYLPRYPAFLFLRGDREHRHYFKDVNLIDGRYVPVKVLKQMHKHSFKMSRTFVCRTTSVSQPFNGDCFSAVQRTGVGYENTRLDASSLHSEEQETDSKAPKRVELVGKILHIVLDKIKEFNASKEDCHKKKLRRSSESESSVARDYVTAVLKALELCSGKIESDCDNEEVTTSKTQLHETEVCIFYDSDGDEHVRYINNFNVEEISDIYSDDEENEDDMSDLQTVPGEDEASDRTVAMPRISSADLVPAFKYDGWPRAAQEWLRRKREWPGEEVVQQVLEAGCHIVAKRPLLPDCNGDPNNEDNSSAGDAVNPYFRLSFSKCELQLAKSLSEPQKLCWRILKAFQKGFLGTQPKVLASYHWKNVLFWVIERTKSEFWTNDNVFDGVCLSLEFMIRCLEKKCVPLYFVRTENLIDGCREDMIALAKERVMKITENPLGYLLYFIENPPEAKPYIIKASALDKCRSNARRKTYFMIDTVAEMIDKNNLNNLSVQSFKRIRDCISVIRNEVEHCDRQVPEFFDRLKDCAQLIVDKTSEDTTSDKPDGHDTERVDEVMAATGKAASNLLALHIGDTKTAFITGVIRVVGNTLTREVKNKPFDKNDVCGGVLKTLGATLDAGTKTGTGACALIGKALSSVLEEASDHLQVQDDRKEKKKSKIDPFSVIRNVAQNLEKKL